MKATFFRLGNIIRCNGNISEIDYLTNNVIGVSGLGFEINEKEVEAVQLSEEILVKLGFKKNEFTSDKIESYYSLELSDDKYIDLCLITDAGNCGIAYLFPYGTEFGFNYVHELQNLYFSLTGEELNVSEILK